MKRLKWLLAIAWMVVIFLYSSQPAVVSNEKSHFVIELFNGLGINLNSSLGELANFVVRKIAHFSEYLILGLLLYNALREDFSLKRACIFSVVMVFLYACTDEIHQLFVPGRSGRVMDVMIDTTGGLTGILITYIVNKVKHK